MLLTLATLNFGYKYKTLCSYTRRTSGWVPGFRALLTWKGHHWEIPENVCDEKSFVLFLASVPSSFVIFGLSECALK